MSLRDTTPPKDRELTAAAIVVGLVLSVVMGAANVYLGLKVGMTVSASIPAAVIGMALMNGVLGRKSVLEANMVQTSASAGESLAAGIIFTMPALILAGIWQEFDYWTTTLIALTGGLLGILMMIPMRRVFVVDNQELKFPEGVACAEVLKTAANRDGDGTERSASSTTASSTTGAGTIFWGLAIGATVKFLQGSLGVMKSSVEAATLAGSRVVMFGADMAPALIGVGVIVGLPIAVQIFAGGAIGWLVAIPLLSAGTTGEPSDVAWALWSTQVRYIGVGAMVVGGVVSIWKVRSGLVSAVDEVWSQFRPLESGGSGPSTETNISGRTTLLLSAVTVGLIAAVYRSLLGSVGITLLTTVIMVGMSFFFTAVASYIVGLVGNSNSPVSGMTITAVLGTGALILLFTHLGLVEAVGTSGMLATLGVAGIVCCVACTAGDVCNDLKTGHLVGTTPRNQQIMQVLGVLAAAFVMAPVMTVLHEGSLKEGTGGIGGETLSAPQASLFANLVRGMFEKDGQLPWNMIGWGVAVGVALVIADRLLERLGTHFRLHVMPVAVGIYLPIGLSLPILGGGLLQWGIQRRRRSANGTDRSVLAASGVIAGESLIGVLLGLLAYLGWGSLKLAENREWNDSVVSLVSIGVLLAVALWIYGQSNLRSRPGGG